MSKSIFCNLVCGVLLVSAGLAAAQTAPAARAPDPSASTGSTTPAAPTAATAPPAAAAALARNDYARAENWLCLPGQKGACDTNLDTTVVAASGKTTVEKFAPAKSPAIDCFYVYPTVSRDPGIVATMNATPEVLRVVANQFARFGQVCRPFAPIYRQFTLAALRARMTGAAMPPGPADPRIGYLDVLDAWNYYLANHNHGRGVVLVGHSQGSTVLSELIKNEIDGKPIQTKIVSAILMGTRLQVPVGKAVGGDFKSVPLCGAPSQTGCVIAYASFRAETPPTDKSLYGKSAGPGLEAACVNPAALGGGSGNAHAYLAATSSFESSKTQPEWVKGKTIATPFVSAPGLLTAECKKNDVASYLAITVHGDPASPRTSEIVGDVVVAGQVQPNWGLHLIDAGLFMGNLIDVVRSQAAAYRRVKH